MNAPRIWRRVEIGVFLILFAYFCTGALPKAWRTLNTDFPNYYLTARLAREHVDTARSYEWIWIEREKDHRGIDQRVVGLAPITPFSTLLMLPLAKLAPLAAKHVWIVANLGMIVALCFLLSRVSGLSKMRAGVLLGLSFPLQRNLEFGQYYILLLLLLTAACWTARQRRSVLSGALVGFAAAIKIYPVLLLLYFLRKKDWTAVAACAATIGASVCISISVLGWGMHRTYLQQVLPSTLRGECLPPYSLVSQSLSTLLHKLFVYEPQWNPHPAANAAWLLVVLHPLLQAAFLVPAVLWIDRDQARADRVALEWSGLLIVALTVSTITASYHFTVLVLPVAILCGHLLRTRSYGKLCLTVACFLAAGYPGWRNVARDGWSALLGAPRLFVMMTLACLTLYLLMKTRRAVTPKAQPVWAACLCVIVAAGIAAGLRHQRKLFDDYAFRLPMAADILLASHPVAYGGGNAVFVALTREGYRARSVAPLSDAVLNPPLSPAADQLSGAVIDGHVWTEDVPLDSLVRSGSDPGITIHNAESPIFFTNGDRMAFLRNVAGKKELFLRDASGGDVQSTSPPMNVYEAAFASDKSLVLSATASDAEPALYLLQASGEVTAMGIGEARYPALSPDGAWLAYSRMIEGNWNLYLRDMKSGTTTRLTSAPCNQIEPSWEADSRTLLYATDCGRALWFTAIARRRIVP